MTKTASGMKWIEFDGHNVPPLGVKVLLRRKPTAYSAHAEYFVSRRVQTRARDQSPLDIVWHPKRVPSKHISHYAIIEEP